MLHFLWFFKLGRIGKKKKKIYEESFSCSYLSLAVMQHELGSSAISPYSSRLILDPRFSHSMLCFWLLWLTFSGKPYSPTQDLKNKCKFLAFLSVLFLYCHWRDREKNDLRFGHFLVSVKAGFFLNTVFVHFVPFLVLLRWRRGAVEGLLVIHQSISSSWEDS